MSLKVSHLDIVIWHRMLGCNKCMFEAYCKRICYRSYSDAETC